MKAIVYSKYGPPEVLHIEEVEKPTPKDNEVLIKVHATTVTAGDWRVRSLILPKGFGLVARPALGIFKPRQHILGTELSGVIESVGKDVKQFKVGDEVFAFTGTKMGCYVEYKTMPEDGKLALKPTNLSFEEAAVISFGGTTALYFLKKGKVKKGDKVLINGASGGVGTAAVQLAKYFGAEVTAVCSTTNLELVKSLGADHVIDYTEEDFTQNGNTYDIIVDTAGTAAFNRIKNSLNEGGHLLIVLGSLPSMFQAPWVTATTNKKIIAGTAAVSAEDLRLLAKLAESGEFKPVIDKIYPMEQIVEAHKYVDKGHKRGNVVVAMVPEV